MDLKRMVKNWNYYYFWGAPIHSTGVSLDKSSIQLTTVWQTEQLTATVTPNGSIDKRVIWSSSDTSIATVSATWLVTCVKPWDCIITVTTVDWWYTASCEIIPPPRTYTIVWNETSDPSEFFVRYEDDAAELTQWSTAFDKFFWYSAVRLDGNWQETAVVEQSSPWVLDITQLWTLTSGNNIMIKFPVRWIKMSKSWTQVTLSITEEAGRESDWFQYYAFQKTWDINANASTTVATQPLYLWAYISYAADYNYSTPLRSLSGKPLTWYWVYRSLFQAWRYWTWWTLMWWYQRQLINAYYMLKYGNPDAQSVVGKWYVTSSRTTTWWTDNQTSATYWTSSTSQQVKLFWLEDWWGNMVQMIWWMFTDASKNMYVALHDFTSNKSTSESQYKNAWTINSTSGSYYLSSILWTNKWMFWPVDSTGTWTTYYTDFTNVRASYFASSWWYAGFDEWSWPFYLNFEFDDWNTDYTNIGNRLMYL